VNHPRTYHCKLWTKWCFTDVKLLQLLGDFALDPYPVDFRVSFPDPTFDPSKNFSECSEATPTVLCNRCTDWLRFYLDLERPEVNERSVWNYELCGSLSMIAPRHYSSSTNLVLELHSDSIQSNHSGFRGVFQFIPRCPCIL